MTVAALLLTSAGCGDRGAPPPGGDKPAESKPAPAPDGFETSWFGHLSRTYEGGLTPTADATKTALKRLGIEVVEESGGLFETTLEAEGRDGTSLVVVLKEFTRGSTRIAVKVGYLLGDRDAAQRIHSEIQSELDARRSKTPWTGGTTPPAGRPTGPP
jgi:hypothetical protein